MTRWIRTITNDCATVLELDIPRRVRRVQRDCRSIDVKKLVVVLIAFLIAHSLDSVCHAEEATKVAAEGQIENAEAIARYERIEVLMSDLDGGAPTLPLLAKLQVEIDATDSQKVRTHWLLIQTLGQLLLSENRAYARSIAELRKAHQESRGKALDMSAYTHGECSRCSGKGASACTYCEGGLVCASCGGEGVKNFKGVTSNKRVKCASCSGTGRCKKCRNTGLSTLKCRTCSGGGKVASKEFVRKRYRELASAPVSQVAGPKPVVVRVAKPSTIRREAPPSEKSLVKVVEDNVKIVYRGPTLYAAERVCRRRNDGLKGLSVGVSTTKPCKIGRLGDLYVVYQEL